MIFSFCQGEFFIREDVSFFLTGLSLSDINQPVGWLLPFKNHAR